MKNPIPRSDLFATPTNMESLHSWCMQHSGSERTVAFVASTMAMNLCYMLIEDMLKEKEEVL